MTFCRLKQRRANHPIVTRPFFCLFSQKSKKMVNEACQGFASWREAPLHIWRRRRQVLHVLKARFIYLFLHLALTDEALLRFRVRNMKQLRFAPL